MTAVTFPIFPLRLHHEQGQTSIKRPKEFAYFSFDDDHRCLPFSDLSLRYYYPPFFPAPGTRPPPLNLSNGFDEWIKAVPGDHHLYGLLETLVEYEARQQSVEQSANDSEAFPADIVTWRGIITKILIAPYDQFSDFELNATCYQGTIYIEEDYEYKVASEQKSGSHAHKGGRRGQGPDISQEMMQFWGYKFEELSVLKRQWSECTREDIASRDREVVNNNSQYCSIARTGMGTTSLILGGEVDCVLGEKPNDPDAPIPWVELKTTADVSLDSSFERQKFERKLLKFWAQSFLLNVPKIVVGYRTAQGYLSRIEEIETQKLPGYISRGERMWDGNTCIKFASAFLEFLKETLVDQSGVWRIKRVKGDAHISIFRVEEEGTGAILTPEYKLHMEKARLLKLVNNQSMPEAETENSSWHS